MARLLPSTSFKNKLLLFEVGAVSARLLSLNSLIRMKMVTCRTRLRPMTIENTVDVVFSTKVAEISPEQMKYPMV